MATSAGIDTVTIANMALSHIGARSRIESLDEESTEAKEINIWYDIARIQALGFHDWSFARKRQTLALHSDSAPDPDWEYRYQRPVDCIRVRRIVNPFGKQVDAVPYRLENSDDGTEETILTNLEDACLEYTFNQTNEGLFSMEFIDALSVLLAEKIAFSLTGMTNLKSELSQRYFGLIRIAAAVDANAEVAAPPRDAEWIRAGHGTTVDESWRN